MSTCIEEKLATMKQYRAYELTNDSCFVRLRFTKYDDFTSTDGAREETLGYFGHER